jgi:hypothetical protein
MERRTWPRVRGSYSLLYYSDIDPTTRVGSILDISQGGVSFETSHIPQFGDALRLTLDIHSRLVRCQGIVIHVRKLMRDRMKVGTRFDGLLEQDDLFLGVFISSLMADPSDLNPLRGIGIGIGLSLLAWMAIIYAIRALF